MKKLIQVLFLGLIFFSFLNTSFGQNQRMTSTSSQSKLPPKSQEPWDGQGPPAQDCLYFSVVKTLSPTTVYFTITYGLSSYNNCCYGSGEIVITAENHNPYYGYIFNVTAGENNTMTLSYPRTNFDYDVEIGCDLECSGARDGCVVTIDGF